MFITSNERIGTCYFEFQFCKIKQPVKRNKVRTNVINHWLEDSLLLADDDFDNFFELYGNIFKCALFPNGEKGFYGYGINYYDKNTTIYILNELKKIIEDKYYILVEWLELAIKQYNGFYILGL